MFLRSIFISRRLIGEETVVTRSLGDLDSSATVPQVW
jgi:hypothetical protein